MLIATEGCIPRLFDSPLAVAAYTVLGSGALYYTHSWFQEARDPRLVFFCILLAMMVTSVGLDALFLVLSDYLMKLWSFYGPGSVFLLIFLGAPLFLLLGAACSWLVGARVSRAFRDREVSTTD